MRDLCKEAGFISDSARVAAARAKLFNYDIYIFFYFKIKFIVLCFAFLSRLLFFN